MSVKRRLKRSCKYKIRYESKQAGMIAVRVLPMYKDKDLTPYQCVICKAWHIAGESRERKQALAALAARRRHEAQST